MKYLVTGGAGFIGSHLCEELTRMNHNVIAVDDLSTGFKSNLPDLQNIEFVFERIQALTDNYFIGLDGIFHLAAQASVPISIKDFYQSTINNLESSVKVFDMARRYGFPVVFASSSAIYGNLPLGDDMRWTN
jgi:UDP-glucose 4-epimerase